MPDTSKDTVPLYTIKINGADLDPVEANAVHEIKVTNFMRLPDVCTLAVGYPAKKEEQGNPFQPLDESVFKIGADLEVKLGGTDEMTTQSLFLGEIVTIEPDFQAGAVQLIVRAYDRAHRMMRSRKQRAFVQMSIADIVKKICGEYGLTPKVRASTGRLDYVIQHNETDWDFLWRLATRAGCEFYVVKNREGHFAPPGDGADQVELEFPQTLRSFRPRMTAVQQVESVNVRGWDHKSKRVISNSQSRPTQVTEAGIKRSDIKNKFPGAKLEIAGQSLRTSGEAEGIAKSQLDRIANLYLAAEGTCAGNPKIRAGVKLKITGVGTNYSGTYRVAKAVHTLRGDYTTQFSNSVGEHTLVGQVGGNGAGHKIDSLIVGIVVNNNDPEKMGRVKVKLPALSDQESFWAPVALPAAGNERGLSMLPVVDEQVIVGFENGDPSYPYVLGSVFNGKDKPGTEMAVQDGSFALKSDHKALVAAKEDITIRSEYGKWIIQIKGGEVQEKVDAGKGGQGAYKGEFAGQWNLKASQAIQIESNMKVTIKAPQISIQAQGPLQLQGNPVQIDGGSAVTISGGVVNLG
jgi:uncharacterized protein involved in type VI secretion and phage assembly